MILLSKAPIPTDAKELKELIQKSNEMFVWKVNEKLEHIERARQQEEERMRTKRAAFAREEQADSVKYIAASLDPHQP